MLKILTKHFDVPRMTSLAVAKQHGAYVSLPKLARLQPRELVALVMDAGLRGRGGAGFPTGKKWSFVPEDGRSVTLIVNADESEPGTFKDRAIIEHDPHLLLEGIVIAARAIRAARVFIYIRAEYAPARAILLEAIREAREAAHIDLPIEVVSGAGAYICGEESALIESIEGKRGLPRLKPPFPVQAGLQGLPTVVNNVETLSNLPFILREGAMGFRRVGTAESPGTKLVSMSGSIERAGVYEVPMGRPIAAILSEEGSGIRAGRGLKAVLTGGYSTPILTATEVATARLDFESLRDYGSDLGCGGVIVFDETVSMVKVLHSITEFFAHESCGKCTPCREGCGWMHRIATRVVEGRYEACDIDQLLHIARAMRGRTLCSLASGCAGTVESVLVKFQKEFDLPAPRRAL